MTHEKVLGTKRNTIALKVNDLSLLTMATVDHIAIYINLTPKLQELLYAVKDHQKLFNYKWCWVISWSTYRPRVSRASVDMSTDMLVDMLIESGCPIVD